MVASLSSGNFRSLYVQGFLRVAVAVPAGTPADPAAAVGELIGWAQKADARGAGLLLFPELCLSGYAIDDLLHQQALLDSVGTALDQLRQASESLLPVILAGAPLRWRGRLFNCAVAIHRGRILGVVPKSYLPNYREFYEKRHFSTPAGLPQDAVISPCGTEVPLGVNLLFEASDLPGLVLGVELCEDAWTPVPPSTAAAMAGASVIANLSASNATAGKARDRQALCRVLSARLMAAYLYAAAGEGESTTDLVWDGHGMIHENGVCLAETVRFATEPQLLLADVDLTLLAQERMRTGSFADCAAACPPPAPFRRVAFALNPPETDIGLYRRIPRFPFIPGDTPEQTGEECGGIVASQIQGLARRLGATGLRRPVLGVSGGLDSAHALRVAVRTMDRMGMPRRNVLGCSLPGPATGTGTRKNALDLMRALGIEAREIDISPACHRMFVDIGHPAATGAPVHDITFENVQAGARAAILFRLANQEEGLVLGTGDMSEIALGWCTYGVGDHMSHYNVNAQLPKTLVRHLVERAARSGEDGPEVTGLLDAILATDITPELVPGAGRTEDSVGPFPLQDFSLFFVTRHGFRPSRVAFMAMHAWKGTYDLRTIRKWLRVFLWRFFGISQFKRSAMPGGPKTGPGISLSPRGDWRAPGDGSAALWLAELDRVLPPD